MQEEWKWVPGYEKFYEISNHGRLRSYVKRGSNMGFFYKEPKPIKATFHKGYPKYLLNKERVRKSFFAHQLVLLAFVGPCPEGQQIRHLDGNSKNSRLDNLKYGTKAENEADKKLHGTALIGDKHPFRKNPEIVPRGVNHPMYGKTNYATAGDNNWQRRRPEDTLKGSKNPSAVLNEDKVYVIKHLLSLDEFSISEIARYYSVDPSTISLIKRSIKWPQVIYPSSNTEQHNALLADINNIIESITSKRVVKVKKPKINNPNYVKKGLCCGERVNTSKLKEDQIPLIFEMYHLQDKNPREISETLDNIVSRKTVADILSGKIWKHITINLKSKYNTAPVIQGTYGPI